MRELKSIEEKILDRALYLIGKNSSCNISIRAAQAEEILSKDKADMVVIGRAQLADPEFCKKAKEGKANRIVRCVGCNQGCYDGFVSEE